MYCVVYQEGMGFEIQNAYKGSSTRNGRSMRILFFFFFCFLYSFFASYGKFFFFNFLILYLNVPEKDSKRYINAEKLLCPLESHNLLGFVWLSCSVSEY